MRMVEISGAKGIAFGLSNSGSNQSDDGEKFVISIQALPQETMQTP